MTRRCTFRDLFRGYLEELISMGGDASRVVTLVHVYEDDGDSPSRQVAFWEWLENELLRDAIDYIVLMRESSGEDNGELDLARNLERVIEFLEGREVKKGRGVQPVQ